MKRIFAFIGFLFFYLGEVIKANFRIAYDVLTPTHQLNHRVVKVELEPLTQLQLMVLTNTITMTPGTLCLDLSSDGRTLYVHSLYSENDDELIASIREDYERRVRNAF